MEALLQMLQYIARVREILVWLSLLQSSSLGSSFSAHCRNLHGISPHGTTHSVYTAAHGSISSSALAKKVVRKTSDIYLIV